MLKVCPGQEYQRKLHPDDIPLRAQLERAKRGEVCHFMVRRNPHYVTSVPSLSSYEDILPTDLKTKFDNHYDGNRNSYLNISIDSLSEELQRLISRNSDDEDNGSLKSTSSDTSSEGSIERKSIRAPSTTANPVNIFNDNKSSSGFRKFTAALSTNDSKKALTQEDAGGTLVNESNKGNSSFVPSTPHPIKAMCTTYSPVYNIREIRTASQSFSALGNDKKLLDIEPNAHFEYYFARNSFLRPRFSNYNSNNKKCNNINSNNKHLMAQKDVKQSDAGNGLCRTMGSAARMSRLSLPTSSKGVERNLVTTLVAGEEVTNNPAKGLGHFVYL